MVRKKSVSQGVTVYDVAEHAGVSIATVSRALSGSRPMSDELREKVQQSAAVLGYNVNLVGRALRQRKTSTIGLVIPDFENPFFSSLAQGISRRFTKSEAEVLVASADNNAESELRAVQSFLGRQVDALVMIPNDEDSSAEALKMASDNVPTVQFDRFVPGLDIPFIGCDNKAGMDLVSDYITRSIDTESQPVILVGGGKSSSSGHERSSRFLSNTTVTRHLEGSFSFEWGQQAVQSLLDDGVARGTLVCGADVIAIGAVSWLLSQGYSIPSDFRVIGFDGVGVAQLAHPTLTTVLQPVDEMTEAIEKLFSSGSSKSAKAIQRFRPVLVERESA